METTASSTAEKMASKAGEAIDKTKDQMREAQQEAKKGLQRAADFIQENPKQSALTAFGFGILLAQLPLRILATGLLGLLLMLLKPAAFLYAGMKLAQDYGSSSNGAKPTRQGFSGPGGI